MAHLIFIAHLPLLRMQRNDDFPIAGGFLTKLPWTQFDALTQGAFSDWQQKYERTDPLFFWYQEEMDLPFIQPGSADGLEEIKTPAAGFYSLLPKLGYGLVTAFHDRYVDAVWAALALAAPGGVAAPPRGSLTFFLPAGEHHFEFGERRTRGARIQGDTDMELAFLPDAASSPLPDDVLARAADLVRLARTALDDDQVAPALRTLLDSAHVSLTPVEQMLLTVTATENLLSRDVTRSNSATMSRRLAHLLGGNDEHRQTVRDTALDLYRHRSGLLHTDIAIVDADAATAELAAQLLAGSIEGVTAARIAGTDLDALQRQLDDGPSVTATAVRWPLANAPGRAPAYRLGPREPWFAGTFSSEATLGLDDERIVSWSPLVGLQAAGGFISHPELGLHIGPLDPGAIVSMEEKDIRRDFIAKVRTGEPVAALAVASDAPVKRVDETNVRPLTRVRDLAVTGLRLAGFDAFIDPELLGWYVYHGSLRHRRETVLRQSIIMAIASAPPLAVEGPALDDTQSAWSLLARYDREARHEGFDRMLDLHRRIHDRHFLDAVTRAVLATICLESMIGPFRAPTAKLRPETLVEALDVVPAESADWFVREGRAFRNAIAHGAWRPAPVEAPTWWTADLEPLGHLIVVITAAMRELLGIWVDADAPVRARHGPQGLFARTLTRRAG